MKVERCKQGQTNNKAKQHSTPKAVTFSKKNDLPRVGLELSTHVHVVNRIKLAIIIQYSNTRSAILLLQAIATAD